METKVIIKQLSHPDNPKLPSKYVGSQEYCTPKVARDGKYITGIDELSAEIMRLPDVEQKKKSSEVKKERESLERLLNLNLDTSSDFWDKFYIVLEDELHLDPSNALDRLKEKFLIANRYVAPSKEAVQEDEEFFNCVYYIYREVEETTKKANKQKNKDKATSILYRLQEENPNKLKLLASVIFGYDVETVGSEEAYLKLKDYLEVGEEKTNLLNLAKFLETAKKTPEQMMTKKILDKAIKRKFVTGKGGIYRRGDSIYGNDYEEALQFLEDPENSGELASLKKEVDR